MAKRNEKMKCMVDITHMLTKLTRQLIILFLADRNNSIVFLFMEEKKFLQVKGNLWIKETCLKELVKMKMKNLLFSHRHFYIYYLCNGEIWEGNGLTCNFILLPLSCQFVRFL